VSTTLKTDKVEYEKDERNQRVSISRKFNIFVYFMLLFWARFSPK